MASISRRGKLWQARLSYKGSDGEFHTKNKSGFKTKRAAELFAKQFEVSRDTGTLVTTESPLFHEYFWTWFETYKESSVRERTKLTYEQAHMNLKKYLPTVHLEDMDRRTYQTFINSFGATHSKATVSKLNSLYHACVKDAMYDGLIERDFVATTSLVFDKKRTRQIDYLNVAEIKKLVTYILETRNHNFPSKYMILTALLTGMRPGEIQGLTWKSINDHFNTISVEKSWNEQNNNFQELKNESSKRIIRVNNWLLDFLKELRRNDPQDRVFVSQYGSVPTSSAINKTLHDTLKKCEIKRDGFHFHSCRHTHVAYLLSQGIDLYAISKRLGHSSITITANVYSYLIDEYKVKTDNQIVSAIDGISPGTQNDFAHILHTQSANTGTTGPQ